MADLNIPKLKMNSDKYIFKKKIGIRRKTKKRLFIESSILFFLSLLLVYVIYLIPYKNLLLQNIPMRINKSLILLTELFSNLYEVFLVIIIFVLTVIILILMIGILNRLNIIFKRKSKKLNLK